ncbi:MAG: TIGR00730 family Rossman fold protein [Anaeromyxobacteraceae bacterium]
MQRVCVFCGSRTGSKTAYTASARAMGQALARRGLGLVYGGGSNGLMGALADAALAAGGEVVGIIPGGLVAREVGHHGVTRLEVVPSMHARKARMAELADGFVALPGGVGTLEELAEIMTWAILGMHAKPVGLLDVEGFYAPLVGFLDHAEREGFLAEEQRRFLLVERDPGALLERMSAFVPPRVQAWISPKET